MIWDFPTAVARTTKLLDIYHRLMVPANSNPIGNLFCWTAVSAASQAILLTLSRKGSVVFGYAPVTLHSFKFCAARTRAPVV